MDTISCSPGAQRGVGCGCQAPLCPCGSTAPGVSTLTWTPGPQKGPACWAAAPTWDKDRPWKGLWVIGVLSARPSWVGGSLGLRQDKAWRLKGLTPQAVPGTLLCPPPASGPGRGGGDMLYPCPNSSEERRGAGAGSLGLPTWRCMWGCASLRVQHPQPLGRGHGSWASISGSRGSGAAGPGPWAGCRSGP